VPVLNTASLRRTLTSAAKGGLGHLGLEVHRVDRAEENGHPAELEYLAAPGPETVRQAEASFSAEFELAPGLSLTSDEIERRIQSYFWHYSFRFGDHYVNADARSSRGIHSRQYRRHAHLFPALLSVCGGSLEGKTVLDVACNCGFWSIQARLAGAKSVLGVEASEKNVEQARFIRELTGLDGLEFEVGNAYDISKDRYGEFDVVLYFGLLYHLEHPVLALERLADVTREVALVDSTILKNKGPICRVAPDRPHEQNYSNRLRMVPSRTALVRMLRHAGFDQVLVVPHTSESLPTDYAAGVREAFVALR
jgi:tRNA (mo5U34)-methyltransferase